MIQETQRTKAQGLLAHLSVCVGPKPELFTGDISPRYCSGTVLKIPAERFVDSKLQFNRSAEFIPLPSSQGSEDCTYNLFSQDLDAALPLIELYKDKLVGIGEVSRIP